MNATSTLLLALKNHFRREPDPTTAAVDLLAQHDANTTGRLRDFTVVWTASDGHDIPANELRCVLCGGLVQGVRPHTLLDLNALAAQHDCQNSRKDGAR